MIAALAIGLVLGVLLGLHWTRGADPSRSVPAWQIPSIKLVQEIRRRKAIRVRR